MMTSEQKAAWLAERCGSLTASNMWKAMDFLKNGQSSAARTGLMHELLAERLTGFSVPHIVTDAMQFGAEYEDEAVDFYVERTGRDVRPSRYYKHPTIPFFGATPDREIDDGLLEVKVPQSTTFIKWVLAGEVPAQHLPQMAAQLLCTGKSWCGFLAYEPRIRDESKRLFMRKYTPTDEYLRMVEGEARKFLDELETMFDQFVSVAA